VRGHHLVTDELNLRACVRNCHDPPYTEGVKPPTRKKLSATVGFQLALLDERGKPFLRVLRG